MMDPLVTVGALASAGQLMDMALKYSYKACGFVSAFKHSEEHAAQLQQRLLEVNALMRDLQQYMEKCSRSSTTEPGRNSPVHYSIVEISRQFANDMVCLHKLIPYDLTAFAASFRNRTKFVLREKDTERILLQLESRKSAATLALEIIGRVNEVSLHDDITSLQSQMQLLSTQQNGLLKNNAQRCDEALAQSRLHEAHIATSIQALRELLVQNETEAANRQDAFAKGLTSEIAEIQIQVAEILANQNSILSSQKLPVVKANAEANNADVLARLIRFELRQQLEPLLDGLDRAREHIDRVATAFSSEAFTNGGFKEEKVLKSKIADEKHVEIPSTANSTRETGLDAVSSTPLSNGSTSMQLQEIILYSGSHCVSTRIGVLLIRLSTYRLRRHGNMCKSTYFKLRADIIPRSQLCSLGFSLLYSSGPDHRGYYSLCPTISMINMVPSDSEIKRVFVEDDVVGFRALLENRRIGIWDILDNGYNLLAVSFWIRAPFICQYILRDSGYGEQLVEQHERIIVVNMALCILDADPSTARQILAHLQRFIPYYLDQDKEGSRLLLGWNIFWVFFRGEKSDVTCSCQVGDKAVRAVRVLIEFGHILEPIYWVGNEVLAGSVFFMNMYLITGGDPNATVLDGSTLLQYAMWLIFINKLPSDIDHANSETKDSEELYKDNWKSLDIRELGDHSYEISPGFHDKYCNRNLDLRVKLLVNLISGGADIYYIVNRNDCHGCAMTLTDQAIRLGIEDIWFDALKECGMHPNAVVEESNRRLVENRKMNGASRTGVDVEHIVEQADTSGLRFRTTWTRCREILEI